MNHLTENIRHVTLDGQTLRIEQVVAVARFHARVSLSPKTFERIDASRALVDRIVAEGRTVYGISTGFGEFSKITISSDKSAQLQENLILSHCVAVGEPLNEETARAMMLLRANALSKGNSGIRREIIETLIGKKKMKKLPSGSEEMTRCTCTAKVSKPTEGSSRYSFRLAPRRISASLEKTSTWSPKRR